MSGRRRQGKSFLLEAACEETGGFYFSAQEAAEAESLSLIGAALTSFLDPVVPFTRAVGTERIWKRERQRFAANILGPRFEELCREWALRFAGDRFGGWPAQVSPGIVNDRS